MELKKIKSIRKSEINALAVSTFKRKLKKIGYLLRYGMPFNKFIKYTLSYLFVLPLAKIKINLGSKAVKEKYFGNGGNNYNCYIAVNIGNAGIGDAITAIRFLRDFADFILKDNKCDNKNPIVFDIFYRSPRSIEFITAPQPNIRRVLNLTDYSLMRKFYDINLRLNTFFIKEEINEASREKLSDKFPAVLKIIENIKTNQAPIEKYIKTRPFSEGILSDAVTAMGLSRENYLNYAAGIDINNSRKINRRNLLKLKLDHSATSKFNVKGIKFITIHDGWDENTKIAEKISTKSYPPEKWTELVRLLKQEIPNYTIVQLGGLGNGSDIEGVDLNLRGKTTLKEAASILSESSLHIDTDSGLVHIATSLGTKCVVLFGPTNAAYCSYSENLNITPRLCGNCWWTTNGWMNSCQKGLVVPECMSSIEPTEIANKIILKLKNDAYT